MVLLIVILLVAPGLLLLVGTVVYLAVSKRPGQERPTRPDQTNQ